MPAHLPPGPRHDRLLGSLSRMRRDPIALLLDARRDHGDIVHFRMATRHVVFLANPGHIRHVLQDNYTNYDKQTPGFRVLRSFLADGLLTNEGDAWLRQRRTAQPAFHRQQIGSFARTMTSAATALSDRWDRDGAPVVNLTAEMSRLTLRIVGETLLSTDVSRDADRIGRALTVAQRSANRAITRLVEVPLWLPTPSNRRLRRALDALDEVVLDLIATRRRDGSDAADLLAMLMDARDEETGEGMSDRQLRDEVMTIFLAGHETTAIALGWTWYLLSTHPAVAARLRGELATVLGGQVPTVEDLPRLAYTEHVIKEAMRLYPPAWIISRRAIRADRIGGYDIPPDTIVFTSPFVTHRLPEVWVNPEGFEPERFDDERSRRRPAFAYFPFGGGPRRCIGDGFAMMEMMLIVATLGQRWELDLEPGERPRLAPTITLRPSTPIRMRPRRRSSDEPDARPTDSDG